MNKKFLSAILFGAMLATSAGTFVSCKDYDDDIKGLQTQIDTNKNAIAELQKLVGAGNWVTSVAASGENLVVTMSNGTSATISGIKGADGKDGVDGKNAAEWTISEDGFWCKDGEKTTNVAVAQNGKDGKDGATAPSPTISDNGMWVVYSWDAAKGEFVAEETEIPAAGTSAYAVKANGIYTLYIADADGEMQEIVLPGTCDSFVMTAPYANVEVAVEHAVWGKVGRNPQQYSALLKAFPEIADHKTNDKLIQGGELPVLVNPMNLELDDTYTFQLVDVKGKVADIELANPTKGIAAEWKIEGGKMSRSAEEGGLWTLEVAPQFDRKEGYGNIENGSLVATNVKGVSSRTAFAYNVAKKERANGNVKVEGADLTVDYAEEGIDVLAAVYGATKKQAIFTLTDEYFGKYILEATNALQVEKYGLTTEGSKLYIANMPANETSIQVALKMTALGLNGSTNVGSANVTVQQTIVASEGLTPKTVTLNQKAQEVRWDIEELGLSALEMHNFIRTDKSSNSYSLNAVKFVVTREADKWYKETGAQPIKGQDGETESYVAFNADAKFYNAKGKEVEYVGNGVWKIINSNTVSEVATIGFDVVASASANGVTIDGVTYAGEKWNADTYKVSLTSKYGNTVIYSAETELTVENPVIDETFVKLVPAFVENGVYQITGAINAANKVFYAIDNALITANGADAIEYFDLDYTEYVENGGDLEDVEESAAHNWIMIKTAANALVEVNKWTYEPEDLTNSTWVKAVNNQLYEPRRVRANIALFGNTENVVPFDFEIVVKSEIYNEDATKVFTLAELSATFGDATPTDKVADNTIDLVNLVTKAVYAAGTDKGKAYNLFNTKNGNTNGGGEAIYANLCINLGTDKAPIFNSDNFAKDGADNYVLDNNNNRVEIATSDLQKWGLTFDQVLEVEEAGLKFYLTTEGMTVTTFKTESKFEYGKWVEKQVVDKRYTIKGLYYMFAGWRNYYTQDGTPIAGLKVDEKHADQVAMYNKYVVEKKGVVVKKTGNKPATSTPVTTTTMADELTSVTFEFVEPTEVDRYFKSTPFSNGKYEYTGAVYDVKAGDGIKLVTKDETDTNLPTGSVTVKMIMTVTCDWGMEMKVPFEITLKTVK